MSIEENEQEYIVTARKWRPLRFSDIVGQEHITTTLQNAIKSGRVHHAYLFSGPRGVGKTTTARIYARALNCLSPIDTEPCNECESCRSVLSSRSLDIIEIDGASNNSVDDIRKLRENAKYPPLAGNYKMYIIDEVHMLSTSAFNALLKTLEEPPPHLLFVFATTESHKVPATILSRCQRYDFRRMEIEDIASQLKYIAGNEGVNIDDESLIAIAKKADGSMRDSQSIFDQVLAFCGKTITYSEMANALHLIDQEFYFNITKACREKNLNEIFSISRQVLSRGYDLQECLGGLLEHLRNILTFCVTGGPDYVDSSASFVERYKQEAKCFSKSDLIRMMNLAATTEQALKFAPQPRVRFELALVQMASMDSSADIKELIDEIRELKKKPITLTNPKPEPIREPISAPKTVSTEAKPELSAEEALQAEINPPPVNIPELSIRNESALGTSAEILKNNWINFLSEFARGDNGLFYLKQTDICKTLFFNSEIIIQFASDFFYENIRQKKQLLQSHLESYFGPGIEVKLVSGISQPDEPLGKIEIVAEEVNDTEPAEPISTEDIIAQEVQKEKEELILKNYPPKEQRELSPIEEAIVTLFGATEVPIKQ